MEKLGSIPHAPTLRVLAAQQDLAFLLILGEVGECRGILWGREIGHTSMATHTPLVATDTTTGPCGVCEKLPPRLDAG